MIVREDMKRGLREWCPYPDVKPTIDCPAQHWSHQDFGDALLSQIRPGTQVIVECGSFLGWSCEQMAKASTGAVIICIDTWLGATMGLGVDPNWKWAHEEMLEIFQARTWDYQDRIIMMRQDTISGLCVLGLIKLEPDLIVIDAGHSYEACYGDCHASMRLFPQATIVLDDFDQSNVELAAEACAHKFRRPVIRVGDAAAIIPPQGSP